MENNVLETSRLNLRPIVDSDIDFIFRGLSDPSVIKHYGVSYTTLEATKEQMKFYADLVEQGTGRWWLIVEASSTIPIGAIGINNLIKEHRKAEIGFWILPEYWGNGFIPEAYVEVEKYVYNVLGLHRIEAFVETDNNSSNRSLEKMGFQLEGTLREVEVKNDRYISLNIWAKLNPER